MLNFFFEEKKEIPKESKILHKFCQRMIEKGNIEKLSSLLKKHPALLNHAFETDKKRTLLHWAIYEGEMEIVKWLLNQKNIQIDAKDADGRSPLYSAIRFSTAEMVEFLLRKGANPNAVDRHQYTPLMWAVLCIATNPTEFTENVTLKEKAVFRILKIIRYLIQYEGKVQRKDKEGNTPHAIDEEYTALLWAIF